MILIVYDIINLTQIYSAVSIDDGVNSKYLTSELIDKANVDLLPFSDNRLYLQCLLDSGALRNYRVIIGDMILEISALFDFAFENIGDHNALIDNELNLMIITFSGDASLDNNVYIAKQKLFSDLKYNDEGNARINQTSGYYFRPFISKKDNNYLVAWENNSVHFTVGDSMFDIIEAETTYKASSPGNVLLAECRGVFFSCQTENFSNRDFGASFLLTKLM